MQELPLLHTTLARTLPRRSPRAGQLLNCRSQPPATPYTRQGLRLWSCQSDCNCINWHVRSAAVPVVSWVVLLLGLKSAHDSECHGPYIIVSWAQQVMRKQSMMVHFCKESISEELVHVACFTLVLAGYHLYMYMHVDEVPYVAQAYNLRATEICKRMAGATAR